MIIKNLMLAYNGSGITVSLRVLGALETADGSDTGSLSLPCKPSSTLRIRVTQSFMSISVSAER